MKNDPLTPIRDGSAGMGVVGAALAAFILIPRSGLYGYWTAMVIELVCRGIIFLLYLKYKALKK